MRERDSEREREKLQKWKEKFEQREDKITVDNVRKHKHHATLSVYVYRA